MFWKWLTISVSGKTFIPTTPQLFVKIKNVTRMILTTAPERIILLLYISNKFSKFIFWPKTWGFSQCQWLMEWLGPELRTEFSLNSIGFFRKSKIISGISTPLLGLLPLQWGILDLHLNVAHICLGVVNKPDTTLGVR